MSDPLVALYIISKLGSSHAHVVSVVIVKHGSRLLWHSSYQGVGSVSLPVDSGQIVTTLANRI